MSKRIIDIIWFSLMGLFLASVIFFTVFFKMEYWSFMGTLIATMSFGFLNIILLLVKVLNRYEIKRLTGAIYATIVAIGVLGYYVLKYVDKYQEGRVIYWIVYGLLLVASVTVLTIINHKLSPQKPVMIGQKK
ncbi:MAG: hypothetical protein SPJ17_00055 [Anaeroplasma sp.]|uniref:hypothetical protein n=1 Tax=Anaeroplasma sp. TaxID=1872523 RepID=UPI002A916FDC|nr:hypothetical protein [Anaeroplasma sp.]MDY5982082.1 hypothetical protein [Anaeroplasma sp.]